MPTTLKPREDQYEVGTAENYILGSAMQTMSGRLVVQWVNKVS